MPSLRHAHHCSRLVAWPCAYAPMGPEPGRREHGPVDLPDLAGPAGQLHNVRHQRPAGNDLLRRVAGVLFRRGGCEL